MEYNVDKILGEQFVRMRLEKPERKLVLHREPVRLRRLIVATSAVAAAVIVMVAVLVAPHRSHPSGDIVCVVNGVHITDPGQIAAYTREALETANHNLRRPGEALSSELSDPSLERVSEMLNELAKIK